MLAHKHNPVMLCNQLRWFDTQPLRHIFPISQLLAERLPQLGIKSMLHKAGLATPTHAADYRQMACRDADIDVAISNSFGFGGHNSTLLLEKA